MCIDFDFWENWEKDKPHPHPFLKVKSEEDWDDYRRHLKYKYINSKENEEIKQFIPKVIDSSFQVIDKENKDEVKQEICKFFNILKILYYLCI